MWSEFKAFLLKQNVVALAIAVVIGAALGKLVTALVDDFIMPIVGAAIPGGAWREATWTVGSVEFLVGDFLSALLNFLIIGLVAWRIAKVFIKPDPAAPATKTCAFCRMTIDAEATRCAHCTSEVGRVPG
jgi:large conductance mechanosensitive channel